MKLLTCFKLCPDMDKLRQQDFEISGGKGLETSFLPNMINCFDESGLEFGIRLSEKSEGLEPNIEKTAFTIGGDASEMYLRTLKALGYEHCVLVKKDEDEFRYSPCMVAQAIAEYVGENPQDIIIMGKEAPNGNNSATAQLVSVLTGRPLISSVIDVKFCNDGTLTVTVTNDGDVYEQIVALPVVLSIGNAVISKLRVPTLKQRMKCKDLPLEHFKPAETNCAMFPEPMRAVIPDRRRGGYLSPYSGGEAVDDIKEKFLKGRLGEA